MSSEISKLFDFQGKSMIITGGAGVLGAEMARALFDCGANVVIMDYNLVAAQTLVNSLMELKTSGQALAIQANVLETDSVNSAIETVINKFGKIDGLINGAGGNKPQATTTPDVPFFDIPVDAIRWVFDLNLLGTILPCQVFGKIMAQQKQGIILNIILKS